MLFCGLPLFPFLFTIGNLYINVLLLDGHKRTCAAIILLYAWGSAYLCVSHWHPAVEKIVTSINSMLQIIQSSHQAIHQSKVIQVKWYFKSLFSWLGPLDAYAPFNTGGCGDLHQSPIIYFLAETYFFKSLWQKANKKEFHHFTSWKIFCRYWVCYSVPRSRKKNSWPV